MTKETNEAFKELMKTIDTKEKALEIAGLLCSLAMNLEGGEREFATRWFEIDPDGLEVMVPMQAKLTAKIKIEL